MIHFPGQKEGEEVLMEIHKHAVVYYKIGIIFLLAVFIPAVVFLAVWFRFFPYSEFPQRAFIVGVFVCLYFLYGLLFTYIRLIDEQFDVFIVTTDRLIDITQISFFQRSVSSAPLEQIQDTTGLINGFFPTLFHYGDLTIKTSSAEAHIFFMDHIYDPDGTGKKILECAQKKKQLFASTGPT